MSNFPKNIGCLIKTPLKHCTQTIFQGGSPWATLILNSMIVVWVLFCVQFFCGMNIFQKPFSSPFLSCSFCLLLCSILLASSPWFIWCFFGISMRFLSQFYGISVVFLWYFYGISKGSPWNLNGIPVGVQRSVSRVSVGFLWDFFGKCMRFPWYFSWISMICLNPYLVMQIFFLGVHYQN